MSSNGIEANKAVYLRMDRKDNSFTLETQLTIPCSREKLFPYFADAGNLESITPPWLHFEILTPLPVDMRAGALIDYCLHLHGIPMQWHTEITLWEPPYRFVDEQKRGPYRKWMHEHTFTELGSSCEMRDFVLYAVPGGWLTNRIFVRRNVRRIFEYRAQKLLELFTQ